MWSDTDVSRRFKLKAPIVQAHLGRAFGIRIDCRVSEAGGLGSFGLHHLSSDGISNRSCIEPKLPNLALISGFRTSTATIRHSAMNSLTMPLKPRALFKELNLPLPTRPARFSPRIRTS